MKKKVLLAIALLVMAVVMFGCTSDEGKTLREMNLKKYMQLGEYNDLELTMTKTVITDEQVENKMRDMLVAQGAEIGITDRAVKEGDIVNVNYVGYIDDVAYEGGTATDTNVFIGSGMNIPGFEEGLIGAMPGDSINLDLTFPEDYYDTEKAGKEVVFRVTINYLLPELNDEVAADLDNDNFSNLEEMKAYARERLEGNGEEAMRKEAINALVYQIIESSTFKEIPADILEEQKESIRTQYEFQAQSYSMDTETYLMITYGYGLDDLADMDVKERMVLQMIANEQGFDVSDEALDAELEAKAKEYESSVDAMLVGFNLTRESYREYLIDLQVYDYLYENSNITINEATTAE